MKCEICKNYMTQIGSCKFCHFEYDEEYRSVPWSVMDLDWDECEPHIEIAKRLWANKIKCLYADIYPDNTIAFILGCYANTHDIARVLGLSEEVVYGNNENGIVILNLFQQRYLWGDCE